MKITTQSSQETIELGKNFAKIIAATDTVILEGNLGGGKTTFVKGVLKGLGIRGIARSPSFTLIRHYKSKKLNIHHIDLYRLDEKNIVDIGIDDYLYEPHSIAFIEWGEKIQDTLPRYIKLEFFFIGENSRRIIFSLKGYNAGKIEAISEMVFNYSMSKSE